MLISTKGKLKILMLLMFVSVIGCGDVSGPDYSGEEPTEIQREWIAERVKNWEKKRSVVMPSDMSIKVVNNFGFVCLPDDGGTGYCAGKTDGDNHIKISVYFSKSFDHEPTQDELEGTIPGTLISSDDIYALTGKGCWNDVGRWYAGYIPEGDIGFPALEHELDHTIGIHHE
jgi:hypothetical protein